VPAVGTNGRAIRTAIDPGSPRRAACVCGEASPALEAAAPETTLADLALDRPLGLFDHGAALDADGQQEAHAGDGTARPSPVRCECARRICGRIVRPVSHAGIAAVLDLPALDRTAEFLANRLVRRFVQVLEALRIAPAD
jgi:hypothetical protein